MGILISPCINYKLLFIYYINRLNAQSYTRSASSVGTPASSAAYWTF